MDEPSREELPPPLDLLWGRRVPSGRGPKQALSAQRIVAAAVELADAGGLAAVTMSRVAESLGFSTMSLYRHVRSKGELIALMVETGRAPTAPDAASDAGWRANLERWTRELLALVRSHPWVLEVPLARLPLGPSRAGWLDSGLQALGQTALSEDEKAAVILLLNGYVFSEARFTAELAGSTADLLVDDEAAATHISALSVLVDADRFPALRRALDAGIFDASGNDRDAHFTFGLERILDGIERLVSERAARSEDETGRR
jgi:AcrR family transcriptional regulator